MTGLQVGWGAVEELTDTAPDDETKATATEVALTCDGVMGVDPSKVRARRMGSDTLVDLWVQIAPERPASGANQVCS
jgi:divalent metal cation (Fe/Co/Zn/Cd) transporter